MELFIYWPVLATVPTMLNIYWPVLATVPWVELDKYWPIFATVPIMELDRYRPALDIYRPVYAAVELDIY